MDLSDSTDKCYMCLELINNNDYPNVIRICKCNTYIHLQCFREKQNYFHDPTCEVCRQPYIFNIPHGPIPLGNVTSVLTLTVTPIIIDIPVLDVLVDQAENRRILYRKLLGILGIMCTICVIVSLIVIATFVK
jgi:hypothetical protein